jgi:hypothetical protein
VEVERATRALNLRQLNRQIRVGFSRALGGQPAAIEAAVWALQELFRPGRHGPGVQAARAAWIEAHPEVPPVPWLAAAYRAAARVKAPAAAGRYHVYVVLLHRGDEPDEPWALYVGQSHLPGPQRFQEHREGHNAAYDVAAHGVGLLEGLVPPGGPWPRGDAEALEDTLARTLSRAGAPVLGGRKCGAPAGVLCNPGGL